MSETRGPVYDRWRAYLDDRVQRDPVVPESILVLMWEKAQVGDDVGVVEIAAALECNDATAQAWNVILGSRNIISPRHFTELFFAEDAIAAGRGARHRHVLAVQSNRWRLADIAKALETTTQPGEVAELQREQERLLAHRDHELPRASQELTDNEGRDAQHLAAVLARLRAYQAESLDRLATGAVRDVQSHPETLQAVLDGVGARLDAACADDGFDPARYGMAYILAELA
jgi:hypothetical protein